jgi:TPR repeat protein
LQVIYGKALAVNRPVFIAILALLVLAGCNHNYQRGIQAYQQGNYPAALSELYPAAEAGNPDAQFKLADMYANGLGTAKNATLAAQWYERAAEQGVAAA